MIRVECPSCKRRVELKLSQHKKKTPFLKCVCGYLAFYNGDSGEGIRRSIQKEPHGKEKENWF